MELYDVVTDLPSLAYCQYEELPADEREWWDDICDRDHAADATYAQLSAEKQEGVAELLGDVADLDLDGYVEANEGYCGGRRELTSWHRGVSMQAQLAAAAANKAHLHVVGLAAARASAQPVRPALKERGRRTRSVTLLKRPIAPGVQFARSRTYFSAAAERPHFGDDRAYAGAPSSSGVRSVVVVHRSFHTVPALMSSEPPSPPGEFPAEAKHALEVLLRAPDPRGGTEVAAARDTFCRSVGALRKGGITLPQMILIVEAAAREAGANTDVILAVVGLCADDFMPPGSSGRLKL